jgi:hypothetical protein
MAISRFQSRFKTRTDIIDNITPNNVVQMNASVPAGEWKPAAWLPVVWQNNASKDYFSISSGKVVSFDASGRVVPSGLLRRCLDTTVVNIAGNVEILEYTSEDVAARVIDITTGDFVTGTGKKVYLRDFIAAAHDNGWVLDAKPANGGDADELAALKALAKKFISAPVGVAAYDVYVWAGDDPANLHFTNYQKQHLIQFFSDVQMRVGHVAESAATNVFGATKRTAENLNALVRYSASVATTSDIMAFEHGKKLASSNSETPVTLTTGAGVAWVGRERSSIDTLSKKGDWYLDGDAGRIFFWEEGGDAANPVDQNDAALTAMTAFEYDAATSAQEKMMHLVGQATVGDFVTFDGNSNFKVLSQLVVADSAMVLGGGDGEATQAELRAEFDRIGTALEDRHFEESLVVGRVYELIKEPRGLLERVRTGWSGSEFGADAKMPGSATKGFSDLITLSDETISDEIAIVNVKIQ